MSQLNEHDFVPSNDSVRYFKRAANGPLLNWLSRWKWSSKLFSLYDTEAGQCLLSILMEDALIAFGIYKAQLDSVPAQEGIITTYPLIEWPILELALQERLPRVEDKAGEVLAKMLTEALYTQLKRGKEICIDDGLVTFNTSEDYPELQLLRGKGTF